MGKYNQTLALKKSVQSVEIIPSTKPEPVEIKPAEPKEKPNPEKDWFNKALLHTITLELITGKSITGKLEAISTYSIQVDGVLIMKHFIGLIRREVNEDESNIRRI